MSKRFLIGDGDRRVTLLRLGRGAAVGLDTCRSVTDGTRIYQSEGRLKEVGIGHVKARAPTRPSAVGRTLGDLLLRNAQQEGKRGAIGVLRACG